MEVLSILSTYRTTQPSRNTYEHTSDDGRYGKEEDAARRSSSSGSDDNLTNEIIPLIHTVPPPHFHFVVAVL